MEDWNDGYKQGWYLMVKYADAAHASTHIKDFILQVPSIPSFQTSTARFKAQSRWEAKGKINT
jgi:hypothetical protein